MLRRRIIPFLLIDKNYDCIKTTNFSSRKYIGDILNNIRIFNEKNVDEIVVLDIDASSNSYEPRFDLIKDIASVCRMPVTYGGGVKDLKMSKKIISSGVEKICLNSAIISNFDLIKEISQEIGSQSLSVSINFKKIDGKYYFVENNGKKIQKNIIDFISEIQKYGAGEIVFNSYNDDGNMSGYDLNFLDNILNYVSVPSVIVGGCSDYEDIKNLFLKHKNIAAGCSSIFIFKGKLKAVLISYPSERERLNISES
ncbi:HisA/HisF-related TIM barrel protein [Candidatus Pelagibacter sp.]|jgi:imidazole glycerol-phosphate synthase subunit HisF|nr:HisA/HisF-related TIM barrel protein [Candidatus Pelagibacter sp.]